MISYKQYLANSAVSREVIDLFLDTDQPGWAQFDPELGYILGNAMTPDGMDGSLAITTSRNNGARTSSLYRDRPCRINTYGNSFTQCAQASDGETWQEYLAGHFGEPIRNLGVGGFGVYQAYRRILRTEQSRDAAENIILYIWGDDHLRSLMRCRHVVTYPWWNPQAGHGFHSNFWSNLEMNLETGRFEEKENLLPTPESLYRMTDPAFMQEALADDLLVQLFTARYYDPTTVDLARLDVLADTLSHPVHAGEDIEVLRDWMDSLAHAYGFSATRHILDLTAAFCEGRNKKLLVALLCPNATKCLLQGRECLDQGIVDHLRQGGFNFFDMNVVHQRDFADFNLSVEDYLKRYYIGHYSPAGNHFFAYSIKNKLLEMLDPPPPAYRPHNQKTFDYKGYLYE